MSRAFATGKHALGICDRCGLTYPLLELRSERDTGVNKHNRVCPECYDEDHPQNFLYRVKPYDPEGLRDPRPDDPDRTMTGNPVDSMFMNSP